MNPERPAIMEADWSVSRSRLPPAHPRRVGNCRPVPSCSTPMFQAEIANKQAEIANQLSKIANDQQAVIVNLLLGLFVVFFVSFVIYGIYVISRYFIKARHSALSTIFIQLNHLLTYFAHFPKQQKLEV